MEVKGIPATATATATDEIQRLHAFCKGCEKPLEWNIHLA